MGEGVSPRACLKKAFRELRVSVCGRFYPNEGGVAGYGNRMRVKYTAKWGLQIAEMIFQTRSSRLPPAIAVFAEFPCLHGTLLITRVKNPLSEGFISKLSAGDFSYFICN